MHESKHHLTTSKISITKNYDFQQTYFTSKHYIIKNRTKRNRGQREDFYIQAMNPSKMKTTPKKLMNKYNMQGVQHQNAKPSSFLHSHFPHTEICFNVLPLPHLNQSSKLELGGGKSEEVRIIFLLNLQVLGCSTNTRRHFQQHAKKKIRKLIMHGVERPVWETSERRGENWDINRLSNWDL